MTEVRQIILQARGIVSQGSSVGVLEANVKSDPLIGGDG